MKNNTLQQIDNIKNLERRNNDFLHVTAYENVLSQTAAQFLNSPLSSRYYFGGGTNGLINWDPFTCLGLPAIESLVNNAEEALCDMLHGSVANLRCLSGVHAMMCAILVATNPGDTVMTVHHDDGGHFSTEPILNRTGRSIAYATYDSDKLEFDIEATARTFHAANCSAIYLDISYTTTPVSLKSLRAALGKDAVIIYDASHTVGLMMGGIFQSPLEEGADIICANTHKTLPGPHKGLIVFKDKERGTKWNDTINNGLFSSSHCNHLIALSVTIMEMQVHGSSYADQIVRNSNALGSALESLGHKVRHLPGNTKRYSETHQVHMYLDNNRPAIEYYGALVNSHISTNFDNRIGKKLFARLGTQELTRRGLTDSDMKDVAYFIDQALRGNNIANDVIAYARMHSEVKYSFDEQK